MSGPLSSNEIEDVVSSVRRLVSAEPRSRVLSRDLGQERLVLTPALRVVADEGAAPLILTNPTMEPDVVVAEAPAPVPEPAAAVEPAADPVAPQPGEVAAVVEAEWEDQIWQEPDPPLAELALEVEEAEVVHTDDLTEDGDATWAQSDADWPDEEALAEVVPIGLAAREEPEAAPMAADVPPADVEVPEPVAAVSADPAEADADDSATATDASPLLYDKDGNPLTVLDEDALHEIVRLLIRQELQGALGERITRNVRKLVRAEINRALAARALD
jgi:hypothetical protein